MSNPLVSVIIPLYSAEKYIAETVTSIQQQTWPNIEVIIVDDGSTDNSFAIAKTFEGENIKIFQQKNKGASAARNKGLSEATGEYIQFLDADDLLGPDKIKTQLKRLLTQPGKIAICPVIHFSNKDDIHRLAPSPRELLFYKESDDPYEFLMSLYGADNNKGGMIPIHSWLIPANLLKKAGKWNEELTVNDDGEYFCRTVLSSTGILYDPNVFCYYRKIKNGGSLSSQKSLSAFKSQLLAIQLIHDHLQQYKTDTRINKATTRMLVVLLYQIYPRYPKTAVQVEKQIKELGGTSYQPVMGGKGIEHIKRVFGWKIARKLQHYYSFKRLRLK